MARTIRLNTGDVTLDPPRERVFSISADLTEISLTFDDGAAHIDSTDWPALLAQVKTRALTRWKFSQMDSPMGEPDFQALLAQVSNTPAYQLLLAGFDIAQVVGLVSNLDDQVVLSRCISLERRVPSVVGPRGLFFVPDTLLATAAPANIEALVSSNKLCCVRAAIADFRPVKKYYIPYATPIDFAGGPPSGTKELWERIRTYYYAFR